MGWRGVVMGEVDQTALLVPDVLAVHDHLVVPGDRSPLSDGDVVVHERGLRRSGEANDETLMRAGRTGVVRQKTRDDTFGGDLDRRLVLGVVALDRRVVRRRRRCATEADEQHSTILAR